MKVVVLGGGMGTRLGLAEIPKPMVPIGGVPLLERTVVQAVRQGFTDFLFLTGFRSDVIEAHFGDGSEFGAAIEHVREETPLGTAGCFNQVRGRLTEPFLVLYGDILMDVDFTALVQFAATRGGAGTLLVHPNDHPFDSDLLDIDRNGRIVAFYSKPRPVTDRHRNLVSAAVHVLTPLALEFVPRDRASDWGKDVFPNIVGSAPLYAYRSFEYVKDIGTRQRLAAAEHHVRSGRLERQALRTAKPAVFLDRDGVINVERGGVRSPDDVSLIPGAAEAIKSLNDAGLAAICITNQPNLAKGLMSWADLDEVNAEIDRQLATGAGAYLDDLFVCPHHPEKGWEGEVAELKVECDCRKPMPGLLQQAALAHHLDLSRSWMIGDRYCDIAAARAAGSRAILVSTGHNGADRDKYDVEPDHRCGDLATAVQFILNAAA